VAQYSMGTSTTPEALEPWTSAADASVEYNHPLQRAMGDFAGLGRVHEIGRGPTSTATCSNPR